MGTRLKINSVFKEQKCVQYDDALVYGTNYDLNWSKVAQFC